MAQGRGICKNFVILALVLVICSPMQIFAVTHVVGDSQGWGFSMSYADWTKDKSFAVGDTLVFNYQSNLHNVVPVSATGYRSCKADSSKPVNTGNDKFTLKRGANYFICSIPGHCAAGMKIQVIAN